MTGQYSTPTVLLIIFGCFAFGYWIVSQWMKEHQRPNESEDARSSQGERGQFRSIEEYYRHVLGVPEGASELEVRRAYRELLTKYHPDHVTHLGDEFLDLAGRRTKELVEAFEFLKNKYDYR